jgi:hypothetical protein
LKTINNLEYKNSVIHPLAISEIVPQLGQNENNECLKLKGFESDEEIIKINETILANKGIWLRSYSSNTGFVDYHTISNQKKYHCILLREHDGTLTEAYVLFIKYKCKKICLLGYKKISNLKDDFVSLNNTHLLVGEEEFLISTILNKN